MNTSYYTVFMGKDDKEKVEEAASQFGERLRKIRTSKGISQYKLADMCNTSQRMIAHYESHVKRPPLNKVKAFAKALDITVDELLGVSKPSKKQKKQEDVSYKIMKRVKIIEKLPVRDQKAIFHFINTIVEKNKLKGKM